MAKKTIGKKSNPTYRLWCRIRERCYSTASKDYKRYGGRGITVCDAWLKSFEEFHAWCLKRGFKPELSINRINNDGPYSPDNCRFADAKEQARNRSSNTLVSAFGETKTLIEWTEDPRCTVDKYALSMRLRVQKLPPEVAITHPVQERVNGGKRNRIVVK